MRRVSVLPGLVLLLALTLPVSAQSTRALQGRVMLADGSPAEGIALTLQIHDGTRVVHEEEAVTAADGRATFPAVPVGGGHLARLAALYSGVTYFSDPIALDDARPDAVLELRVSPVVSEGRPLHLDTLHLIVQAESPTRLRVLQFVTVSNAGDAAWAGGPALPDGRRAGMEIPVPAAALELSPAPFPSSEESLPAEAIQAGGDRVLDPRPVPPTGRQAAVTYLLDAEQGPIEVLLPLPYPTQSVNVLVGGEGAAGLVLDRTNLTRRPAEQFGGETYDLWTAATLDPGGEVRFRIGPPAPPLLPPYGWGLAGLGLALLLAVASLGLAGPGRHDVRRCEELLTTIARIDLQYERGELEASEYHLRRGRELERLILLERRLAASAEQPGDRGDG